MQQPKSSEVHFAAPDAQRPSAYEKQSPATKHAPSKTRHGNGKALQAERERIARGAKR